MNYQNLQSDENETLSVEDEKIRQMCSGLKRVSAPKDFDFRLKARFANHEPQTSKSPIFAFLKYAAPLGLVIVFLGVIVSNNLFSVDNTAVPLIAANFTQTPIVKEDLPFESGIPSNLVAKNTGPNADFESVTPKNENSNKSSLFPMKDKDELAKVLEKDTRSTDKNGESRDSASTQPRVFTPQMFNSSKKVESANGFTNSTSFSVKDILSQTLGIEVSFSGNGWKVQSVRPNSPAERSGIKINDVIEAVGDIKLLTETIQTNSISSKKITILRDGKRFEKDLK